MTAAVHLEELTIQAFRGYGPETTFRFDAPLTLVYAANGTGKTSLCDAAEWLLTGKVDRLGLTKDLQLSDGLRCRFSPNAIPTLVSANIRTAKGQGRLQRAAEGASFCKNSGNSLSSIKDIDLLRRLVGWNAPPGMTPAVEAAHRRRWLWAARFFSSETIAPLIDSGRDEETRVQILSDLLGGADLAAQENKLGNVLKGIRPDKSALVAEIDRLKRHEQELRQQTPPDQAAILAAGASACARVHALLNPKVTIIPIKADTPEELLSHRNSVERLLEGALLQQRDDRAACDTVVEGFDYHRVNRVALEESCKGLVAAETEFTEAERVYSSVLADHHRRRSDLQRELEQQRHLKGKWRQITELAAKLEKNTTPLYEIFRSKFTDLDLSELQRRADRIQLCLNELPNYRNNLAEIARMEAALAALGPLPAADAVQELAQRFEQADRRLREVQAAFDAAAGPLELLRQYADQVLRMLPDDHRECPTCGHDWGNAAALRDAVKGDQANASTVLADLARNLADAKNDMAAVSAQVKNNRDRQDKHRQLTMDMQKYNSYVAVYGEWLHEIRLNLPVPELDQKLQKTKSETEEALHLRFLEQQCLEIERKDLLSLLPAEIIAVPNQSTQEIRRLTLELKRIDTNHADHKRAYRENFAEINRRAEMHKKQVGELEQRLRPIEAAWRRLAGDEPLATAALQQIMAQVALREADIKKAEAAFTEAGVALRQLNDHTELKQVRDQLEQYTDKFSRLKAEEERLTRLRDSLSNHRKKVIHRQLSDLSSCIDGLYARMQANEVFESIGGGDENAPLQWNARTGDVDFNPTLHFSQGQRQDLSLALFLARARSLGGTFFLDEPVQHLDDLNRAALLDTLRAVSLDGAQRLQMVVTTSSRSLLDHLIEKCRRIRPQADKAPFLRIYELEGNPRLGTKIEKQQTLGG
jgi:DNA repair protein SbcC/Rad50